MASDRDRNERPSWREIDQRRDGRAGGRKADAKKKDGPDDAARNRYKNKQRDKAFSSLFTDPERDAAADKIHEQVGKEGFAEAVDTFIESYGFPTEYNVLQLILEEHPDAETQAEALSRMDEMVDEQADSTQQVFKSRVKLLRLTAKDAKVRKLAGRIAKRRKL